MVVHRLHESDNTVLNSHLAFQQQIIFNSIASIFTVTKWTSTAFWFSTGARQEQHKIQLNGSAVKHRGGGWESEWKPWTLTMWSVDDGYIDIHCVGWQVMWVILCTGSLSNSHILYVFSLGQPDLRVLSCVCLFHNRTGWSTRQHEGQLASNSFLPLLPTLTHLTHENVKYS